MRTGMITSPKKKDKNMPSKTAKQHRLFAMIANNPSKAKELKIPQKVGKEFMAADKGKKFNVGGAVTKKEVNSGQKTVYPEDKDMGKLGMRKGGSVKKYAAGGPVTPTPTKNDMVPTAKEKESMRREMEEKRRDKKENESYNKASSMKFAKGGAVDKDMKELDKNIQSTRLKDYMKSEAALRTQRDTAKKPFAKGGTVKKKYV